MKELTYASVCSGIECASVAVRGLPLKPIFFSEIEPYPCAVLKYRYPEVPNLGDMTKISYNQTTKELTNGNTTISLPDGGLDILFGGTPCQDFSIAGLRKGAGGDEGELGSGTRSSLCFHYVRLLREIQPRWFIYENVAGMLSSNQGRDFAHFLLALGQSGYGSISYRILDAQFTRVDGYERAVPQRRRRVWVVGHLGTVDRSSAEVLLEPYRLPGDHPPRRRTEEDLAAAFGGGAELHDQVVGSRTRGGYSIGNGQVNTACDMEEGVCKTLDCMHDPQRILEVMTPQVAQTLTRRFDGSPQPDKQNGMPIVTGKYVHTNSNGKEVMSTLSTDLEKQVNNQMTNGGGVHYKPLCWNFDMFDKAENHGISLCAKRASDTNITMRLK